MVEADAADTTYTGMRAVDLKTQTFLDILNGNSDTINASETLSFKLDTWKFVSSNDGYPGFVELSSDTPDEPDDGSSSGTGSSGNDANDVANVYVNGKEYSAGISETTTENGKIRTAVTVDTKKLDEILDSAGDGTTVMITVSGSPNAASGVLTGQMVKNMENKAATLIFETGNAAYTLPASEINIDVIAKEFGEDVDLSEIEVEVTIAQPADATVQIAKNAAENGGFSIVVPAVDFSVTCTHDGKTVEVKNFNAFVERTIAVPNAVDHTKITTAVVVNADGTVHHVPTKIIEIDGMYYAVINSLTNSVYTLINNSVEFADTAGHWANDTINNMASRKIISGYTDGTFDPNGNITRAEYATIVVRALGLKESVFENSFSDVTQSDWYCGYVQTASAYGIITGYGDGRFAPNDKITREQAMVIIARAMEITRLDAQLSSGDIITLRGNYTNAAKVSAYVRQSAAICIETGIISGKENETLAPKDNITRAETAIIVQRLLQKSKLI